jgi:thiazole synthase
MALAMKLATQAGRLAFHAGRMARRDTAAPSSPVQGVVGSAKPA